MVHWWEYVLSSTWYLVGWAHFLLAICPIAFLLFDVRPLVLDPILYVVAFVPYLSFNTLFFFSSMKKRGYSTKWIWLGQALTFITFSIFVIAAISALAGKKITFSVTPKGKTPGARIPFTKLWSQLVMLALCLTSIVVGGVRLFSLIDYAVIANTIWVTYNFVQLSALFFFNKPVKESYGDYMIFKAYEDGFHSAAIIE